MTIFSRPFKRRINETPSKKKSFDLKNFKRVMKHRKSGPVYKEGKATGSSDHEMKKLQKSESETEFSLCSRSNLIIESEAK